MARVLASEWPPAAELLAARHWPGPLTLVVPKQPQIPDAVTAGLPTVGLRMPAHPLALALIERPACPIAAPSANRFTEISPTSAEHVRQGLGDRVDLILDGGSTPRRHRIHGARPDGRGPLLLRPGMISREEIEALIGPVDTLTAGGAGAHAAPGLHARHYSPRTRLILVRDGAVPSSGRGLYLHSGANMPADPAGYAAALYATLHQADAAGYDWIAVEEPPGLPAWAGIRDRLIRAATPMP